MKNNIFYYSFIIFFFLSLNLASQELEINSSKIQHDNINKITILEGNVNSIDEKSNKTLISESSIKEKNTNKKKTDLSLLVAERLSRKAI